MTLSLDSQGFANLMGNELSGNGQPRVMSAASRSPESFRNRLYQLLPAIYRIRDELEGDRTLQALFNLIESELQFLETDIGDLYENWFIETCEAWVVPYIGDLLAVQDLQADPLLTYGQQERRAYVANTLLYRQRKGTTPVLEQLARDITGWGARVVESQPLLATRQSINHPRLQATTVDLRQGKQAEQISTPFETRVSYSPELRGRVQHRGLYNPNHLAIYLWRLQSYPLERVTARPTQPDGDRCFTVHPLGISATVWNQPQTETDLTTLAAEINLPIPLTWETIAPELEQRQRDWQAFRLPSSQGYFGDSPVLQIWAVTPTPEQQTVELQIPPEEMLATPLTWENPNWQLPQPTHFTRTGADGVPESLVLKVAIDPGLGRLLWLGEELPDRLLVSYAYGFSGDVGGGCYDRPNAATEGLSITQDWQLTVEPGNGRSLHQAVCQWNQAARIWQACYDRTYLPLKRIFVGEETLTLLAVKDTPVQFPSSFMQPGILRGLNVIAKVGDLELTILPGIAIDGLGQALEITAAHTVLLDWYSDRTMVVLLSYVDLEEWKLHWQVEVIAKEVADRDYPPSQYIRLAQLELNENSRIAKLDQGDRATFVPGIMQGLEVQLDEQKTHQVLISAGQAVTAAGQLLQLPETPYQIPQTWQPGQMLLLYAWLKRSGQVRLEVVTEVETGLIVLTGNQTYEQSFTLQIPASKTLKLVSQDGDRPHLQGDLAVRGMSHPKTYDAGEFQLEGILLEGNLTILPGNLKRFHLVHSTIAPTVGRLSVEKAKLEIVDEDTEDLGFLALLIFAMTLFQRLLRVGFATSHLSTTQKLDRLMQLTLQQVMNLSQAMQQVSAQLSESWLSSTQFCLEDASPENPETDSDSDSDLQEDTQTEWLCLEPDLSSLDADNQQLRIYVNHSICGTIQLVDTISHISIEDSIVDADVVEILENRPSLPDEIIQPAIVALGATSKIHRSTILGTTEVRSLEAKDSLFSDSVTVLRQQMGCIRFSYIPPGSTTPHRYHCQPDLALAERIQMPTFPIAALAVTAPPSIADQQPPASPSPQSFVASDRVFYYHTQNTWIPLVQNLPTATVTALCVIDATAQLLAGNSRGQIVSTALPIQTRLGQGQILSRGVTVTGRATRFMQEVAIGDGITIENQTRIVVDILSNTELSLDQPFLSDFSQEPAQFFWITRANWLPVTTLSNTAITSFYKIPNSSTILAATAGSGVFRSDDHGVTWRSNSQGLHHLEIQSLIYHPVKKLLLAGTKGGGVFYSPNLGDSWSGGDPIDPTVQQSGLVNPEITSLAINDRTGMIFAGSAGGGVYRSADSGRRWSAVNEGLTDLQIAFLWSQTQISLGTVHSDYNQLILSDPQGIAHLAVGDCITVQHQEGRLETRRVIEISGSDRLLLNDAFDPDLPKNSTFTITTLIAITASGQIFRSQNDGQTWQSLKTDWRNPDLTCFLATSQQLFVGTRTGNVLQAQVPERLSQLTFLQWQPRDRGLNQVDQRSRLLEQLQPDWTSLQYGQPGYAQLSLACPREMCQGAENQAEMGVFNFLHNSQRESNLRSSFKEYLSFGLQADIIYVT
ncbi:MAG: hypothetical protein VKJ24_15155 [Synechococcales bacterium]|nr:hypothetical protein [Synechococcales bacterium]